MRTVCSISMARSKIIFYTNDIKFQLNTSQLSMKAKQARGDQKKLTLIATTLQHTVDGNKTYLMRL